MKAHRAAVHPQQLKPPAAASEINDATAGERWDVTNVERREERAIERQGVHGSVGQIQFREVEHQQALAGGQKFYEAEPVGRRSRSLTRKWQAPPQTNR